MYNQPAIMVVEIDQYGNFMRETVAVKDALLKLLRFSRMHPHSVCTIELRQVDAHRNAEAPRTLQSDIGSARAHTRGAASPHAPGERAE
jgi:hypothetical protein